MVDELSGRLGEGSKVGLDSEDDVEGHRVAGVEGSTGWKWTRHLRKDSQRASSGLNGLVATFFYFQMRLIISTGSRNRFIEMANVLAHL